MVERGEEKTFGKSKTDTNGGDDTLELLQVSEEVTNLVKFTFLVAAEEFVELDLNSDCFIQSQKRSGN